MKKNLVISSNPYNRLASCSYQIQMLKQQEKCIRHSDEDPVQLFNDYQNIKIG